MRVAIYARVSTESQADSLQGQVTRLRAYADQRWPGAVVSVFRETASGATMRRPELQRLLRVVVTSRSPEVVIIERLDRLSRRVLDGIHIIDQLTRCDVGLVATGHAIDTSTPAGRLQVQLLQVLAEFERELILERSRAGIEAARARGVRFGRPPACRGVDFFEVARRRSLGDTWAAIAEEYSVHETTLARQFSAWRADREHGAGSG